MTYLVVCDHLKQVINTPDSMRARQEFGCKLCVRFDLKKKSEWIFHNVRVYRADDKDAGIVASQREEPPRERQERQPKVEPRYIPL